MVKDKFYNLPKPLSISDYQECVEIVKGKAVGNHTIKAVYLMGGEWVPGISDLDIVVIYKDFVTPEYLPDPWSISSKAKFIFTHRYLSFDETTGKQFYFLYPKSTANLRLICGEPVNFKEPSSTEEQQWTLAFIIFDVLTNKLCLFERFRRGPYDARNLLGQLYSLIYTVEAIKKLTGEQVGSEFMAKVKALKQNWFLLGESIATKELLSLVSPALGLVEEIILSLDRFLQTKGIVFDHRAIFSNDKYRIAFSGDWSADAFSREFSRSLIFTLPWLKKKIELFRLLVPSSFSFFLRAYGAGEGKFNQEIRRCLCLETRGNLSIPTGAISHIQAMSEAFRVAVATGGKFKIPFSFGLRVTWVGWRESVLWKVLLFVRDLR